MTRSSHVDDLNRILMTEFGSTAWKMNHAGSDRDISLLFVEPTKNLLDGTFSEAIRANRSRAVAHDFQNCGTVDAQEIGSAVHLLLQGNCNLIQYVLSPVVLEVTPAGEELRRIVAENPAKNIFASTAGMGATNMKRYVNELAKHDTPFSAKKAGQIVRIVDFAIRVLDGGKYEFLPVKDATREMCEQHLQDLVRAHENSGLPEKADPEIYRDWLWRTRLDYMDSGSVKYLNARSI